MKKSELSSLCRRWKVEQDCEELDCIGSIMDIFINYMEFKGLIVVIM